MRSLGRSDYSPRGGEGIRCGGVLVTFLSMLRQNTQHSMGEVSSQSVEVSVPK